MEYRQLGRSGLRVSEIGLGCEHLQGMQTDAVARVIDAALECGVNLLDVFMSEPNVRQDIGKALAGRREKVLIQAHIGAAFIDGQYTRTRERAVCETFFEDILTRMGTDYMDIGMLHFVDTMEDYEAVFGGEMLRYALELKKKGVIRALGMSSHAPAVALRAVESGLLDVLMFSLNPAYDLLPEDTDIDNLFVPESYQSEKLSGVNSVRAHLYSVCEARGVGITVMKGLGGGALLSEKASPFGVALSPAQCIHYALTRPGVASILTGARTAEEILQNVRSYEAADEAARDYSVILGATAKYSMSGRCMYCNHCLPCPARIDIAQVNKFLDLALLDEEVPATVREHYGALENRGGDCIACGSCEGNCPFGVPVIERMEKAKVVFGS